MTRHGTNPSPAAYLIRLAPRRQASASMRFAAQEQAVHQHCRDADADRAVCEVEGRPMQRPDVEIEKVDDRAEANPVDDIADRAADDESDRDGEQRSRSAAQPIDQNPDDGGRRKRKDKSVDPGAAIKEAKADPAIVGQGEIEKRGDSFVLAEDATGKECENSGLGQLIECGNGRRRGKPAREHQPTAAAQRRQRSAWPGRPPTSGNTRQQRSQRAPGAGATSTPTSGKSASVKAPSGGSPGRTVPAEVMHSSARSTSRS